MSVRFRVHSVPLLSDELEIARRLRRSLSDLAEGNRKIEAQLLSALMMRMNRLSV
jgi:hypothetical protein